MDATMSKPWTQEELDLVKRLVAEGKSASAIAANLVNRSRNSVIGAVHRNRIKLLFQKEPNAPKEKRERPPRGAHLRRIFLSSSEPKEPKHVESPAPPPSQEHYVPFLERRYGQCKFIVEKRNETYICCGATATRSGWCDYHANIVYRPFDPKPVNGDRHGSDKPIPRSSK